MYDVYLYIVPIVKVETPLRPQLYTLGAIHCALRSHLISIEMRANIS